MSQKKSASKNKIDLKISRIFDINIPIYNINVIVSYGSDKKFLLKSFKDQPAWKKNRKKSMIQAVHKIFNERPGATYLYNSNHNIHYIHLFQKENYSIFWNHLSHEVTHLVFNILQILGMKLTDESEEAYAYLHGYITQQIYEKFIE